MSARRSRNRLPSDLTSPRQKASPSASATNRCGDKSTLRQSSRRTAFGGRIADGGRCGLSRNARGHRDPWPGRRSRAKRTPVGAGEDDPVVAGHLGRAPDSTTCRLAGPELEWSALRSPARRGRGDGRRARLACWARAASPPRRFFFPKQGGATRTNSSSGEGENDFADDCHRGGGRELGIGPLFAGEIVDRADDRTAWRGP